MFLSTIRQAVREKRKALADRDFHKARADKLEAEVERLRIKLEKRTDFMLEREFRIVDRFFTSEKKTYAITDEIRSKEETLKYDAEAKAAAKDAFLSDKLEFLEQCAREAGFDNWKDRARQTFNENYSQYIIQFEQNA